MLIVGAVALVILLLLFKLPIRLFRFKTLHMGQLNRINSNAQKESKVRPIPDLFAFARKTEAAA
jgi:hypothetical protein